MSVPLDEAQAKLAQLLERVHAGEDVVISKAGKPYVRLVPVGDTPRRVPGLLKGVLDDKAFFDPLPEEELESL